MTRRGLDPLQARPQIGFLEAAVSSPSIAVAGIHAGLPSQRVIAYRRPGRLFWSCRPGHDLRMSDPEGTPDCPIGQDGLGFLANRARLTVVSRDTWGLHPETHASIPNRSEIQCGNGAGFAIAHIVSSFLEASIMRPEIRILAPGAAGGLFLILVCSAMPVGRVARAADAGGAPQAKLAKAITQGRELFNREWTPNDRRSHGGDGLGPVYNERSCVGCQHQGPSKGGGGSAGTNIEIIPATPAGSNNNFQSSPGFYYAFSFNYGPDGFEYRFGDPANGGGHRLADPPLLTPTRLTSAPWCGFIRAFAMRSAWACTVR